MPAAAFFILIPPASVRDCSRRASELYRGVTAPGPLQRLRRIPPLLAAALVFLTGICAGVWSYHRVRERILADVARGVQRNALAFEGQLDALTGTRADLGRPAYVAIKARLERFLAADSTVKSVRLLRCSPRRNHVVLLVGIVRDAGTADPLPGDSYDAVLGSPALQRTLGIGTTTAEGPLDENIGAWVRCFSVVESGPKHSTEGVQDVFMIGFTSDFWSRDLWALTAAAAVVMWLLLGLPLAAYWAVRRQTEQRNVIRNLSEAMEQANSALAITDVKGRIEYVNAGFCRQIGYTRRELIGKSWREFRASDTPPETFAEVVPVVHEGKSWTGEWTNCRKDGSTYPVRGTVSPVSRRDGGLVGYVAVFEDMTEIRHTEQVLREARDRAEAGDRAKGQFLATMSHEVRTPLNGVVGFAGLLLDTELTPEQQEFVESIRTSSETLIQLTADILDYARIDQGRFKLQPQPCDPRECIESALDLVAAAAERKNIELLHWIDDDVPAAIVADVNRLRQVIVNLVNNAVKFTSTGEVEVRARLASFEPPGPGEELAGTGVLEFSVRDTGIGIAAEHHGKIFRPFSQVDDSTTRRYGGTGLGLAICKNIVELMQGRISFSSEPGRGSTFVFTVRVPVHLPPTPASRPLAGQNLAVVADHAGLRAELRRLGSRLGAEVFERDLATLSAAPDWNLALIDVSGAQALELAARRTPRPGLPPEKIVALVPMVLPKELRSALRTHFRLVLNKPPHHDMVVSLLSGTISASTPPFGTTNTGESFGLRVLIVEDNPVNQRLIQKVVTNLGCRWSTVENGRAAVEEVARNVPDLILMDLHMPEQDGLETTAKIRSGVAGAAARNVWIIALTADARDEQRTRVLAAGANDYLTKPVRLPELIASFRRYLTSRHG